MSAATFNILQLLQLLKLSGVRPDAELQISTGPVVLDSAGVGTSMPYKHDTVTRFFLLISSARADVHPSRLLFIYLIRCKGHRI